MLHRTRCFKRNINAFKVTQWCGLKTALLNLKQHSLCSDRLVIQREVLGSLERSQNYHVLDLICVWREHVSSSSICTLTWVAYPSSIDPIVALPWIHRALSNVILLRMDTLIGCQAWYFRERSLRASSIGTRPMAKLTRTWRDHIGIYKCAHVLIIPRFRSWTVPQPRICWSGCRRCPAIRSPVLLLQSTYSKVNKGRWTE